MKQNEIMFKGKVVELTNKELIVMNALRGYNGGEVGYLENVIFDADNSKVLKFMSEEEYFESLDRITENEQSLGGVLSNLIQLDLVKVRKEFDDEQYYDLTESGLDWKKRFDNF